MAKEKLTFESASKQLDEILQEMENEETGLDKTIELYSKAADLIAFCNKAVNTAQIKIDEINAKLFSED